MLCFLEEAIHAFYADFFEVFDKVPHYNLIHKTSNFVARGCQMKKINDYLANRSVIFCFAMNLLSSFFCSKFCIIFEKQQILYVCFCIYDFKTNLHMKCAMIRFAFVCFEVFVFSPL